MVTQKCWHHELCCLSHPFRIVLQQILGVGVGPLGLTATTCICLLSPNAVAPGTLVRVVAPGPSSPPLLRRLLLPKPPWPPWRNNCGPCHQLGINLFSYFPHPGQTPACVLVRACWRFPVTYGKCNWREKYMHATHMLSLLPGAHRATKCPRFQSLDPKGSWPLRKENFPYSN